MYILLAFNYQNKILLASKETNNYPYPIDMGELMTAFLVACAIIISFALRPFAYKSASKEFPPELSSYFTAVWCLVFAVPTLPFCLDYLFYDGKCVFLHWAIIFPLLKGYSLYLFMKSSQIVNKENTSGNVFWGVIALAISALISYNVLNKLSSSTQFPGYRFLVYRLIEYSSF